MAQILLRNIPDEIVDKLRRKAKASNASLESTVRQIIVAEGNRVGRNRSQLSTELLSKISSAEPTIAKVDYRDGLA